MWRVPQNFLAAGVECRYDCRSRASSASDAPAAAQFNQTVTRPLMRRTASDDSVVECPN